MTFPTARRLTPRQRPMECRPAAVGLFMDGAWVLGALVNQQWDFAGWSDPRT